MIVCKIKVYTKIFKMNIIKIKPSYIAIFLLLFFGCNQNQTQEKRTKSIRLVNNDSVDAATLNNDYVDFTPISNLNFDLSFKVFSYDTALNIHPNISYSKDYSSDTTSIFCFRGNHFRNSPSRGNIIGKPKSLTLDWKYITSYDTTTTAIGTWGGGSGWTGQPCAIRWNIDQKRKLGIKDEKYLNNESAYEIIIGSLCGDIYFLNSDNGVPTRDKISIKNPIKGTVSVDPRKNGLLYVGQGIQHTDRFGAYVFDMFSKKEVFFINGKDKDSKRFWGAFDSNPLIDCKTGQAIWPAENGIIYKFTIENNRSTSFSKMLYNHSELFRRGIESSIAAIGSYGFFLDNSGSIICVELNTLEPIWNVTNFDDSDASVMIDKEKDKGFFLYIGNEVDKLAPLNNSYFRKIDASNGQEVWKVSRNCFGTNINGKTNSGGILASPVLGKNKGKDLVYCLFSRVDTKNKGELVAINKYTGNEVFSVFLDSYSWASPVDFYDENGNIYLFFTDVNGTLHIIDGRNGEIIYKEKTKFVFEASPIIIDDKIFVGARDRYVLCFNIETN